MPRIISGHWARFHRFNPWKEDQDKAAAKRAHDLKIEYETLRQYNQKPKKTTKPQAPSKAKITLSNVWKGKDASGD